MMFFLKLFFVTIDISETRKQISLTREIHLYILCTNSHLQLVHRLYMFILIIKKNALELKFYIYFINHLQNYLFYQLKLKNLFLEI
jgi:hypothetical protein